MAFASLRFLVVSLYHYTSCHGFLFRINRQDRKIHFCKYFIDISSRAFQITFDCTAFIVHKYSHLSAALLSSGYDTFKPKFEEQQTDDTNIRSSYVDELSFKNTCMADSA